MFVVSYYNKDKIGYRFLGWFELLQDAISLLERNAKINSKEAKEKIYMYGFFATPNGFILLDTEVFIKKYKKDPTHSYGLPYKLNISIIKKLQELSVSYIRDIRIKKIFK